MVVVMGSGGGREFNISYICSFINLANLFSCSMVLCTGSDTAKIEGLIDKIRSSPQHCCEFLLVKIYKGK